MDILREIKKVFTKEDGEITPEIFERITKNEKTMRLVENMPDEVFSPWYRLFLAAQGETEERIFLLAMERADIFKNLTSFVSCSNQDYIEIACKRALPLATTASCFRKIAKHSQVPAIKKKGIDGALATAKTTNDCMKTIYVLLGMKLENEEDFIENALERTAEKSVALTKGLYESYQFRESLFYHRLNSANEREIKLLLLVDFVLARSLAKSPHTFKHKGLLRAQVDLCQKRNGEIDNALDALLTSILEFGKYEYLCAMVPKEQKRLS